MDYSAFYAGRLFDAYRFLGAHVTESGTVFRTFAPAAEAVSVIGEFNGWQETPMKRIYDGNFWECEIENASAGMMYKFRIFRKDRSFLDHCDPYGFFAELRPNTASILQDLNGYEFGDAEWMDNRTDCKNRPMNIYELHFGSWRKPEDRPDAWYSYAELSDLLIPYLKENGFNFLEIMPLGEYPSDESWGYQSTGFFSPTSRYGKPDGLREFVDRCHRNGIGVLIDFVPVHFAVDDYALADYDGTPLYEYPSTDVGRSEWGSCNFMHSRGEVRSFLQSAANYWLTEFHFDGLRMDAVSNLIYWQGDESRGENREAIQFLRDMNLGLKALHPGAILAAEDSTAYQGVTVPAEQGGLGFDYKWDLGWMHDTLSFFQTDPEARPGAYHKLTFSMQYFYDEAFLLPLSHDESVHGKATVLQKMNGQYEDKFPQARALYLYMVAHPGKKLNFMGNELGHLREWDEKRELDWNLTAYPVHDAFRRFLRDLNLLYLSQPALYEMDYERGGFLWLDCAQEVRCLYAFERRSKKERILAVFNLSGREQKDYRLRIPDAKRLTLLIASDMQSYGGNGAYEKKALTLKQGEAIFTLSAYSGRCYQIK